jgi:hypothetical protein
MRPRRTPDSDAVFRLPGGTEDNDLFVSRGLDAAGAPYIESVWDLDGEERAAIAAGATVELRVYGAGTPPVSLAVGPSLATRRGG